MLFCYFFLHDLDPVEISGGQVELLFLRDLFKLFFQEVVVWSGVEVEGSHMGQHMLKLNGQTLTELSKFNGQFSFHDLVVFFFLALSFHGLPREAAFQKIDEDINKRFEIIPSSLFYSEVSVDGGISGSTCEIFVVFISNMFFVLADILFGKSEVDHEYFRYVLFPANEEVVRFYVPVEHSP